MVCVCRTYLFRSSIPDDYCVTTVDKILDDPATHDAETEESELESRRKYVLFLQRLRKRLNVKGRRNLACVKKDILIANSILKKKKVFHIEISIT